MKRTRELQTTKSAGFTVIELLLVSVIVCILATIVVMTYSSVRAGERNKQRQERLDALKGQLETYYVQASKYPSLTELNNAKWRALNMKGLEDNTLRDPQWKATKTKSCGTETAVGLAGTPTELCYSYQATTTDGSPCEDTNVTCAQYTLTTVLEGGEKYVKSSLN